MRRVAARARAAGVVLVVMALIGVAVSVLSALLVFVAVRSRESLAAHAAALTQIHAVEHAIDNDLEALEGIQAVIAFAVAHGAAGSVAGVGQPLDEERFRTLSRPLLRRHHGIQAVEWSARVSLAQRERFERRARHDYAWFHVTELAPDGNLMAAGRRPSYVVVRDVTELPGNEHAVGFDLASEPIRRAALERARDTGEPSATGRIVLVQETGTQLGFLVFAPVYRSPSPPRDVATRRARLAGFVVLVYRAGDRLESAVAAIASRPVDVVLRDESASDPAERFLALAAARLEGRAGRDAARPTSEAKGDTITERVAFGGRLFAISSTAAQREIVLTAARESLIPFLVGLAFTALVLTLLGRLARNDAQRRVVLDELGASEARYRTLADASRALSASLDLAAILDALLALVVPRMADWAMIAFLDESGSPRAAAGTHADPEKRVLIERLIGESYLDLAAGSATARALRTGSPQIVARWSDDEARAALRPGFAELFAVLGWRSVAAIPLIADGVTIGALTMAFADDARGYADADLPLFDEIARRASVAVGNAKAFERERHVAQTLQGASLPASLPHVPRLRFSSVYEPGKAEAQIGGDWYDALRLADGRVVISIGDVSGSGLDAAVTMGSIRQVIRGVAQVYPDPATILDAADKALRSEQPDRMVSAFVGVLDPVELRLTYASAGHPAPLLRHGDGTLVELQRCGPPLGLRGRDDEPARTVETPPGSLLVLYTDGLTEATRDIAEGERRLRAAMSDPAVLGASDLARAIHDAVLRDGSRDDVAILAIRVAAELDALDHPLAAWSFDASDADAAHGARRAFGERLRAHGVTDDDLFNAELVFGELVGNVVRHAPGQVEVALDCSGAEPVLHVLDRGVGFYCSGTSLSDSMSESGRGLFLVTSLTKAFHVARRPEHGSHALAVLTVKRAMRAHALLCTADGQTVDEGVLMPT